ncbi:inositol-3-phosphate synthase [Candidatus Bathycorpusculum sp.]|uniref:inositol-3-phosphate synthase n=1 Tax=Candidatus Bathycorpusculum sp. TaxID=2994959 RepID=UPI0028333127|nr:inositol-3-phosphate synthase [Candidatus Termitimicrobium sp.]MCL2431610.1 inositol-3-phosphate synthase [Candidatus Termitimicrobium sp.]
MPKIKVALIGVGNCAASFIQGIQYYSKPDVNQLGLRNPVLAGYTPKDIEIVAAFDIDSRKVSLDVSEAIFAKPNNAPKVCDVPNLGVKVSKGPLLDGVGESAQALIEVSKTSDVNIAEVLIASQTEIAINLLPSGASSATRFYAMQAIAAGCAFINATPNFIASDPILSQQFKDADLPLAGDDLVDQIGSTALHKTLLKLLSDSGVRIHETYQLDVGGGTESIDTMDRTRDAKRNIKTEAVAAALDYKTEIVAGSTDYVDFLQNKRDSYFWISGTYFCNAPLKIDLKFQTTDAPNAGSSLFDVVRAIKVALSKKQKGTIDAICAYGFKHPPKMLTMEESEVEFAKFIA